ncbi:MAG TPA: hypothetical protein GX707_16845 [Epulopiscium sp.]|nr:hypothetical protein [Candidatus Epulonipiscium sp.]
MKGNKYSYAIIGILILATIHLLSVTILNSEYLFIWGQIIQDKGLMKEQ